MKRITTQFFYLCFLISFVAAGQVRLQPDNKWRKKLIRTSPSDTIINETDFVEKVKKDAEFKPSFQVGAVMHAFFELAQPKSFNSNPDPNEDRWQRNFTIYRARILVGAALSPNGNFFLETELPSPIGSGAAGNPKNVKVSQILLDCQYEHNFSPAFSIIAGKMLVSNNRNGLQGVASLMANDFTHYQYPYNLFETDPLQGNFGRDIGINTRGFLAASRLEYRLGIFTGRRFDAYSPYRIVGRIAYNFLDPEKDLYYAGTKLGKGKTLALAVGVDAQTTYYNLNIDGFLDVPIGTSGAITVNTAFAYMDGGDNPASGIYHKYSFATLIPKQTVQFLELGYYFKKARLQPWIKYENQQIIEESTFPYMNLSSEANNVNPGDLDKLVSNVRLGGGVNYFFNEYNTNIRLSYTEALYGRKAATTNAAEVKGIGQLWLQVQVFFF